MDYLLRVLPICSYKLANMICLNEAHSPFSPQSTSLESLETNSEGKNHTQLFRSYIYLYITCTKYTSKCHQPICVLQDFCSNSKHYIQPTHKIKIYTQADKRQFYYITKLFVLQDTRPWIFVYKMVKFKIWSDRSIINEINCTPISSPRG